MILPVLDIFTNVLFSPYTSKMRGSHLIVPVQDDLGIDLITDVKRIFDPAIIHFRINFLP